MTNERLRIPVDRAGGYCRAAVDNWRCEIGEVGRAHRNNLTRFTEIRTIGQIDQTNFQRTPARKGCEADAGRDGAV